MWHIVMPCLPIFLYNLLNAIGIFGEGSDGVPRSITISIGIIYYYIFSETIVGFSAALESNKSYIVKTGVAFRACYLSVLYAVLSNFVIRYLVFLIIYFFYDYRFSPNLIYAIFYFLVPVLVGASLGLILSVFTVFYRDFNNFVQTIAFYMLFGSGVFGLIDGTSTLEIFVSNLPSYITVANAKGLILPEFEFNGSNVLVWTSISLFLCSLSIVGIRNSKGLVVNYLR